MTPPVVSDPLGGLTQFAEFHSVGVLSTSGASGCHVLTESSRTCHGVVPDELVNDKTLILVVILSDGGLKDRDKM